MKSWELTFTDSSRKSVVCRQTGSALRGPDAYEHEPRLPPHPESEQEPGSESTHMEGVAFLATVCFIFKNTVLLG